MEAFIIWVRHNKKAWIDKRHTCGEIIARDRGQKEGWRAALEWTLKTAKELDEQDIPIDMGDVIRQELETED